MTSPIAKASLATLLFAGGAGLVQAADLPRRVAPPPVFTPVPVFTWTGFYAGFNAGAGFGANDRQFTTVAIPANSLAGSLGTNGTLVLSNAVGGNDRVGFVGGGQVGYNYQFTPGSGVVVGVEADAQYADLGGTQRGATFAPGAYTFTPADALGIARGLAFAPPPATVIAASGAGSIDWFGTVRGRLGYAFERVLFYATGGFAYGEGPSGPAFTGLGARQTGLRTGWAAGGGVEYALPTDSFLNFFRSSAVTLKVEGLYVNLEDERRNGPTGFSSMYDRPSNTVFLRDDRIRGSDFAVVRAGLNYKFGAY